jgi:hypothetical protein
MLSVYSFKLNRWKRETFEVLTVVLLKIQIIWDVTLCSCVSSNRNFE